MKKQYFGYILVLVFAISFFFLKTTGYVDENGIEQQGIQLAAVLGAFSGLILWVWMLTDLFKRDMKYKWLWGWLMIIVTLPVSIVYFFIIYR